MNKNFGCKLVAGTVITSMLVAPACTVFGYTKDETVYTKTGTDGSSYKTIVTEHLKNTDSLENIMDASILNNIENTNGDETYTQNDKTLAWKANGNDIYYQGDTDKELPITMKITYKLDGEEIEAKELAGKTGKLEINIEFTNNEKHAEYVNGKNVTMYTPFVVVSGAIFDNDKVSNLEITNGKVVDNGSKSIVVGLAMPGMQESLGINSTDFEIPGSISIKADAKDFEMGNIYTYASPKLIEKDDIDGLDKLNEIFDDVNDLSSASTQLVDGANKLNNGIKTLDASVGTLNDGANQLSDGTSQLANGTSLIASNMKSITSGATSLSNGQKEVTSGLNQIQSKLPSNATVTSNKTQLTYLNSQNAGAIAQLQAANAQIGEVNVNNEGISGQLLEIQKNINDANSSLTKLNLPSESEMLKQITEYKTMEYKLQNSMTLTAEENIKLAAIGGSANLQTELNHVSAQYAAFNSLNGTIKLLGENKTSLLTAKATNTKLIQLLQGNSQSITSSLTSLDDMSTLSAGVSKLQAGSTKLQAGANQLQAGSTKLQVGATTLVSASNQVATGAQALANGTTQLKAGTTELVNGSQELTEGITKFDTEGIQKIAKLVNTDLKDFKARAEKLKDLSDEYVSYADSSDEASEVITKFITITDSIKKDDDAEEDKITPDTVDNSVAESPEKNENTTSNQD